MGTPLHFDPQRLRRDFNTRAFSFSHSIHASGLFTLTRLAALADFLDARSGKRDIYPVGARPALDAVKNLAWRAAARVDALKKPY